MPLIQSFKTGEFTSKLYEYKNLGYGYKIYTKVKGKNTCIAQSCVYFKHKEKCIEDLYIIAAKMHNELNIVIDIAKTLF